MRRARRGLTAVLVALLLLVAGYSCGPDHYVASSKAEPFHRPTCSSAARITSEHLVSFQTRDEAIKAGHRPCNICNP